jgi:hypothetical protein
MSYTGVEKVVNIEYSTIILCGSGDTGEIMLFRFSGAIAYCTFVNNKPGFATVKAEGQIEVLVTETYFIGTRATAYEFWADNNATINFGTCYLARHNGYRLTTGAGNFITGNNDVPRATQVLNLSITGFCYHAFSSTPPFTSSLSFTSTEHLRSTGKLSSSSRASRTGTFTSSTMFSYSVTFTSTASFSGTHQTFSGTEPFSISQTWRSTSRLTKSNPHQPSVVRTTCFFTRSQIHSPSLPFQGTDGGNFVRSWIFNASDALKASDLFEATGLLVKGDSVNYGLAVGVPIAAVGIVAGAASLIVWKVKKGGSSSRRPATMDLEEMDSYRDFSEN